MGYSVFKTLRVIVDVDENKISEITNSNAYCLKCNPVTLKVFLNPSYKSELDYILPIRKDIEKGIIRKFIIKFKYVNFSELKEVIILLGYAGVNRFNYKKLLNKDAIKIIEEQDLIKYLDVGFLLGKYKIKLIGLPRIVANSYNEIDIYNITLSKNIFIGIVNNTKHKFLLFDKMNSAIDDYLKYKLFSVPLELYITKPFTITDCAGEEIILIYVEKGLLIIKDHIFDEEKEIPLPKGELSYDKQTSNNIETYKFSIVYNTNNIKIIDELNHVVIYNTIDGIDVMIDLSQKLEELIERNKIVVLKSDIFEIILTSEKRFSIQFTRSLNIKKVSIS